MIVELVCKPLEVGYPPLEVRWYYLEMLVLSGILCGFNLFGALHLPSCCFTGM